MRSLLVSLALLSLAAPALSQTTPGGAGGRRADARPGAGTLGLRGADALAREAAPEQAEAEPAPTLDLRPLGGGFGPPPLASLPAAPNPQQCRLQCAQDYYFCLAGDASDECPQAWGQCRLGCDPGPGAGV